MNIEAIMIFLITPLLLGLFTILIFRFIVKKVLGIFFQSKNPQSEIQSQDEQSKPARSIINPVSLIITLIILGQAVTIVYNEGNRPASKVIDLVGPLLSIAILTIIVKTGHNLFKTNLKDFKNLRNSPLFQSLKNSKDFSEIKNLATTNLASELPLSLVVQNPKMLKSLVAATATNKNYIQAELDKITKIKNLKKLSDQEYDFMGTQQDGTEHRYRMKMEEKNKNQIIKMTRYS